ncbi:FimV/HubP family polar landmark protein [Undibacterium flavidum]|uniref:FimV family protein n=1 Tax=Undibacterium flavidum TaxID=2762297 RepID=A0ABR6YDF8_9BURK|nr:FimV/HubP family polar landmark protein [Undibacterium flavidum]MBC3874590.1 FimV family protein [Undibacterium flavidum]
MHNYKRLPISFLGRNVLKAAALSSLLVFSNAYATGLGKLTVLSSLGQPLRAEIELTSPNKEEINSLVPKIASIEAFRQANIEFNPALLSLRFAVEQRGSSYIIRVTSTQAMNEPWVDFLLEMNASNGKLVREYTFLLDPAELANSQSAQIANPSVAAVKQVIQTQALQQESKPKITATNAEVKASKRSPEKSPAATNTANSEGRQYQVRPGDTLMRIASANLSGVSLDQMLVSIYRANPQAFVGDNMNRLKAGQILTIPDAETARTSAGSDAHAVVQTHSANFNAYRNKLAGQVLTAPSESVAQKKQAASGAITAKVKEVPTAANESLDKLKLSKVADANAKKSPAKGLTEEDRIAKDKALAEANARIKELERNASEMNKLLAMPAKSAAAQTPVASASAAASKVVLKPVEAPVASKPTVASAVASVSASASASTPTVASASTPKAEMASASVKASASASVEAASAASVASASKPKRPPPPPAPIEEESSWFDSKYLIAAGLLAAIGGAIGVYSSRKKKVSHQFEDSILTGSSLKANSMFGSTGGQSVDTNNSVFNSNFAPSASQLDANEVDPVAEADVYIAYGRDSQAEEILKEALRTQPDRHAVRLKLLEIYFGRKDLRSFELFAGELYGMTRGEGEEWGQAASMGISLDPNNPLYAGASAQVEAFAGGGLGQPTQPLEDLDPEALLENSLSEDMLDSISIIDTASAMSDDTFGSSEKQKTETGLTPQADFSLDDGLDFDLDISEKTEEQEEFPLTLPEMDVVSSIKPVQEEPMPTIDFGSIDFDLGTDEKKEGAAVVPDVAATELATQGVETSVPPVVEDEFDIGSLDFDMGDDEPPSVVEAPLLANDEVELNFGLDVEESANASSTESAPADVEEISPYNAEMATKLDLAVAYREIGDKEGARELLDEVIKGGSNEQIEKARKMLEQLG